MTKRDYALFVKDIIDAMNVIERFVEGMTLKDLTRYDKTSSEVIRKFEIIGKAVKKFACGNQKEIFWGSPERKWEV